MRAGTTGKTLAWSRASVGVVAAGVVVRVVQWSGNSSLWLDELMLVESLTERGLTDLLFGGLANGQVAPVAYLALTKLTVLLFGEGELALRLVPLCASIVALLLFWRLARALLGPQGTLVATAGFALNPLLISLSAVVKQYSTDVLATVLIMVALHSLWSLKGSLRSRVLIGAAAGAVGLLSIPSVLVAIPAMAALLYHLVVTGGLRSPDQRVWALGPLVVWAAAAGAAALWAQANLTPDTQRFMVEYWTQAGAFAPPILDYPTWVVERWRDVILPGVFLRAYTGGPGSVESLLRPIIGLRMLLGALLLSVPALLSMRGPGWAAVVLLPCLLALGLSRFEVYPMDSRTSVFLLPLLLLLMGAVAALFVRITHARVAWSRPVIPLAMALLFLAIFVDRPPIYVVQQEREVIQELSLRRGDAEPVVAFEWSRYAFRYYGMEFGIGDAVRFTEAGSPEDLSMLNEFRGERSVWILFTHSDDRRRSYLLCYLDEIGLETERFVLEGSGPGNPVSLHRYDLSGEAGMELAEVGNFPTLDEAFDGDSPRCRRQVWSGSA